MTCQGRPWDVIAYLARALVLFAISQDIIQRLVQHRVLLSRNVLLHLSGHLLVGRALPSGLVLFGGVGGDRYFGHFATAGGSEGDRD